MIDIDQKISAAKKSLDTLLMQQSMTDGSQGRNSYNKPIAEARAALAKLVDEKVMAEALAADAPAFDDAPNFDAPAFDLAPAFESNQAPVKHRSSKIGPGIYRGLSNADYHAADGISKTGLDYIANNPADYLWYKSAPVDELSDTKALDIGSAIHCLLLEPDEFKKRFIAAPKVDLRTNAGKDELAEFTEAHHGFIIISADDWRKLYLMRDSAMAHPTVRWIFEQDGVNEESIFWTDHETGELCKVRPDRKIIVNDLPIVVDVKSVAGLDRFPRNVEECRYHVQDAMYSDGIAKAYGLDEQPPFWFLQISTTINCGMYPVTVTELDDDWKAAGFKLYRRDLNKYHECRSSNDWIHVSTTNRPRWAR